MGDNYNVAFEHTKQELKGDQSSKTEHKSQLIVDALEKADRNKKTGNVC